MNWPVEAANWESGLAIELWFVGDYEEARRVGMRSVAFFRESGSRRSLASAVENLALALTGLGHYRQARQHLLEALKIHLELRDITGLLFSGGGMARIKAAEGKPEQALELLGLVLNHPTATGPDALPARSLLADLEAVLPPEVVAAGLERGIVERRLCAVRLVSKSPELIAWPAKIKQPRASTRAISTTVLALANPPPHLLFFVGCTTGLCAGTRSFPSIEIRSSWAGSCEASYGNWSAQ